MSMIHGKFDLHSHCFNVKVPQFGAPFIVPFDDPLRRDLGFCKQTYGEISLALKASISGAMAGESHLRIAMALAGS